MSVCMTSLYACMCVSLLISALMHMSEAGAILSSERRHSLGVDEVKVSRHPQRLAAGRKGTMILLLLAHTQ